MENTKKVVICSLCNIEFEVPKKSRINNVKCDSCKTQHKVCLRCNSSFESTRDRIFCSTLCSRRNSLDVAREKQKSLDWSSINKKSYSNGNNYVAGGKTKWYVYKNIKVQGTYELRVCKVLDKMKELDIIKSWEYTNDRIPYIDVDGSKRTYLLDFKVFNKDNSVFYIEVKGYSTQTDFEKWKSAKSLNLDLRVWFDKEIAEFEKMYFEI